MYYQTGRLTGGLKQLKFNSSYIRPRCMRVGGHNFSVRLELEMGGQLIGGLIISKPA